MRKVVVFVIYLLAPILAAGQADSSLYNILRHTPPVSQGKTGTCWSFAATSMLESEVLRKTGQEVKLSEMFFVYYEYLDRVTAWVESGGEVYVEQGSESNALVRLMKKYGAMPLANFEGKRDTTENYNHSLLMTKVLQMLQAEKGRGKIRAKKIINRTKMLLDQYIGTPPEQFEYNGIDFTPVRFLEYIDIRPNDYFSFMSTASLPYHQKGELVEADNWWHNADYYNVYPEEFLLILKEALQKGYSVCVCGDVSEPGYNAELETGVVVEYDLPPGYFSAEARELRLKNGSTTDDHCIHAVGIWEDEDGVCWFMIKDSGRGGFKGKHKGYRFIREDYVLLKMMNLLLYKYGASTVLDTIIK